MSQEPSPVGRRRRAVRRTLPYLPLAVTVVSAAVLVTLSAHVGGRALSDAAVAVAVLAGLGLAGVPSALRRRRAARRLLADVDAMSGTEFEDRLAGVFEDLGYDVETTAASGDFGADLLVARRGRLSVVQAKRSGRTVGITAVQEVLGARRYYGADHAMVVTNSALTAPALALADAGEVEVLTRAELAALLGTSPAGRRGAGCWLFALQVAGGLRLVAALVLAVPRITWRVTAFLRRGRRGVGN